MMLFAKEKLKLKLTRGFGEKAETQQIYMNAKEKQHVLEATLKIRLSLFNAMLDMKESCARNVQM